MGKSLVQLLKPIQVSAHQVPRIPLTSSRYTYGTYISGLRKHSPSMEEGRESQSSLTYNLICLYRLSYCGVWNNIRPWQVELNISTHGWLSSGTDIH